MRQRILFSFITLFITTSVLFAQGINVAGTVTESGGTPIPGVNVVVKGTTNGVATDFDGNYSISANQGDILVFSSVGFTSQEVTVNGSVINITMSEDSNVLDEVVVVGYGTQSRRDLTGSVASIKGEDISRQPVASVDNALQGQAAGVLVTTPSGTPGAGINIQIRGTTSISAGNEPLYVIDGIPMIPEDLSGLFSGGQKTNSLADINPGDIQSIEVLKDASATAIYGSRGANGVVLITTKRGSTGRSKIDFNTYYGFQNVTNVIDMQSSKEFLELMNEAAQQDNRDFGTDYPENYVSDIWGYDPNDPDLQNTDWYGEIFRTAPIQNYDLSVSGGNDKTTYFTSVSYFDQEGVQIGTGFDRISGRINIDSQVSDAIKVGSSVMLSRTNQDRTINDNSLYGVVINTLAADPLMPVYESDGSYADPFWYFGWWMLDNPVLVAKEYYRQTKTSRALANIYAEIKLAEGFKFKTTWSADYTNLVDESYTPIISRESSNAGANGLGTYGSTEDLTWITENYFSYDKTFGKHSINAILGASYQASDRDFSDMAAQGYPSDQFTKLSVAAKVTSATTSGTQWGLASYYFRGNYNYDDRFLFTFTGRADGSSRFGTNNKFGFFPSGSVAWRMSNENFLKNSNTISDLKIRASYGLTGNQEGIGNFSSRGLYGVGAYRQTPVLVPTQLSNSNLSWENTAQYDIGIDLGLFNNRLSFTADYFVKTTNDLLLGRSIPGTSGFSGVTDNIGEIENRGLELSLRAAILTGELTWNTSFNISFIENEVKKLEVDEEVLNDSHILAEGQPIGTFFLIDQDGVDPETGNIIWDDFNGDGFINSGDRQIVGNVQPDFFGGWNNSFAYKGFDLNFLFQFTVGNDIFNHSIASYENLGWSRIGTGFPLPDGNNYTGVKNRWREPGDRTDIPRASLESDNWKEYSTRWLEDGSYLRLKNLDLGYNLSAKNAEQIGLRSLRIYVMAQNLWTLTDYTGFDPEVSQNARNPLVAGADFGTLPQTKSFSLGVKLGL